MIEERKNFFSSDREGYKMIESSITAPEWLEEIPKGRPAIVVADGVFEYIAEEGVKDLLNRITDSFPRGQIAFDVMNSFAVRSGRSSLKETTGAEHRWAVDDVGKVNQLDPKLKRIDNLSVFRLKYFPPAYRLIFGLGSVIPSVRNMIRLLRYEF